MPMLDDVRSVASMDEDFDVHTLDYLGLDAAATLSELRNQAQAAITVNFNNNPACMRTTTVLNPYHLRPSAQSLRSDLQRSLCPDLAMHAGLGASALGPAGILRSEKVAPPRNGLAASVHFPNPEAPQSRAAAYLAAPSSSQNRAVSPKTENASTQMQTPTRSLWIGNLDSSFTSEQLIHVFAPYGAIESLRLLPEKVRAIVFCAVAIESTGG